MFWQTSYILKTVPLAVLAFNLLNMGTIRIVVSWIRCHEVNSHEINCHQINSHEINLPRNQLATRSTCHEINSIFNVGIKIMNTCQNVFDHDEVY